MEFNQGDIFILNLPSKNGREQEGLRPGIIISDTKASLVHIIPLTSNLKTSKFVFSLKISKNKNNNLEKDSVALIFQLQILDKKRLLKKIGKIEDETLEEIKRQLSQIFNLNIISKEKLSKYFEITETALKQVKKNIIKGKENYAKEIIDMVSNYLSDAKHFQSKSDFVNAFAALNYAHGWLDSGVRLDVFNVKDDKLFTIK